MSNRFHNKFHSRNHHTNPTDRNGLYPDSAYDPIASREVPFQGEFYSEGDITTTGSISAAYQITGQDGVFSRNVLIGGNLTVQGDTTQLNTIIQTTSAISVINTGTGPALRVTQTGYEPIAHFIDSNGDDVFLNNSGMLGLGTNAPTEKLTVLGNISAAAHKTSPVAYGYGDITADRHIKAGGNLVVTNASFLSANVSIGKNLQVHTNTLYVSSQGNGYGRVGINTTIPNQELTVVGDGYVSQDFIANLNLSGNRDAYFGRNLYVAKTGLVAISGSNGLTNVGINVLNPLKELTVKGSISASNDLTTGGSLTSYNIQALNNLAVNGQFTLPSINSEVVNSSNVRVAISDSNDSYKIKYKVPNDVIWNASAEFLSAQSLTSGTIPGYKSNKTLENSPIKYTPSLVTSTVNLSAPVLYDSNSNSTQWKTTYDSMRTLSGAWNESTGGGALTLLKQTSGSWDSVYTTVKSKSGTWDALAAGVVLKSGDTMTGELKISPTVGTTALSLTGDINLKGTLNIDTNAVTPVMSINSNLDYGRLEVGGISGGYIDFKSPFTDDFDIRVAHDRGTSFIATSGDLYLKTGTNLDSLVDRAIFKANGFVGLGTSNPLSALQVIGGILSNSAAVTALSAQSATINNLTVTGASVNTSITSTNGTFSNLSAVNSFSIVNSAPEVRFNSNVLPTSVIPISSSLVFRNSSNVIDAEIRNVRYVDGSSYLQFRTTAAGSSLTDRTVSTMFINNSRVGIGTITPGAPLEVAGGIRAAVGTPTGGITQTVNGYSFAGAGNTGLFATSNTVLNLIVNGYTGMYWDNASSNRLYINSTAGDTAHVFIGTSSFGTGEEGGYGRRSLVIRSQGSTNSGGLIELADGAGGHSLIYRNSTGVAGVSSGGYLVLDSRMKDSGLIFESRGDNGTITFNLSGILGIGGDTARSSITKFSLTPTTAILFDQNFNINHPGTNQSGRTFATGAIYNGLTLQNNSNPATARAGSYINFTNNAGSIINSIRSTHTSTDGYLVFETRSAATPTLTLSSNGNVGIGTMNPNEALTVVGNISATGNIFGAGNSTLAADTVAGRLLNISSNAAINGTLTVNGVTSFNSTVVGSGSTGSIGTAGGGAGGSFEQKSGSTNNVANITDAAYITFHRPSAFAVKFGLDTDNQLKVGGWSYGTSSHKILHEGATGVTLQNPLTINNSLTATYFESTNTVGLILTNTVYPQLVLRDSAANTNRWGVWVDNFYAGPKRLVIGPQNTTGSGNGLIYLTRSSTTTNDLGNVGIATSTPNERLTVVGNISSSSTIFATNITTNSSIFVGRNDTISEGGQITLARSADNVGAFALDVIGTGTATDATGPRFRILRDSAVPTGEFLTVLSDGKVGIGTITPATGSLLDVAGMIITRLGGSSGSTGAISNANGTGPLELRAGATVAQASILIHPQDGLPNVAGGIEFRTGGTTGTGTTKMLVNGSGNIGVGTATPLAKLHLTRSNVTLGEGAHLFLQGTTANDTYGWLIDTTDYSAENVPFRIWARRNGANTEHLRIDNVSGWVGLGTTTPSARLHVNGNGVFNGTVYSTTADGFRIAQANRSVIFRNDNSDFYLLHTAANDPNGIFNNNRPFSFRFADGIVGLAHGTSTQCIVGNSTLLNSKTHKFQVSGDIYATGWIRTEGNNGWYSEAWGGGWHMTDATWIRAYGGKPVWVENFIGSNNGLTIGYNGQYPQAAGASIRGWVGIGLGTQATISLPTVPLEVNGSAKLNNGQLSIINTNGTDASIEIGSNGNAYIDLKKPSTDDYDLRIGHWGNNSSTIDAVGDLSLRTGASTNGIISRVVVTSNGKVGIGTTAPTKSLEVVGDILTSGRVTADNLSVDSIDCRSGAVQAWIKFKGGLDVSNTLENFEIDMAGEVAATGAQTAVYIKTGTYSKPANDFTITATITNHGLQKGERVYINAATGSLSGDIRSSYYGVPTNAYIVQDVINANTFTLWPGGEYSPTDTNKTISIFGDVNYLKTGTVTQSAANATSTFVATVSVRNHNMVSGEWFYISYSSNTTKRPLTVGRVGTIIDASTFTFVDTTARNDNTPVTIDLIYINPLDLSVENVFWQDSSQANVRSVVDTGNGSYYVNWLYPFATKHYGVFASGSDVDGATGGIPVVTITTQSRGGVGLQAAYGTTLSNLAYVYVVAIANSPTSLVEYSYGLNDPIYKYVRATSLTTSNVVSISSTNWLITEPYEDKYLTGQRIVSARWNTTTQVITAVVLDRPASVAYTNQQVPVFNYIQ